MMRLILGNCLEQLRVLDEASIDAVVTDPPYGINFMGKSWDGKAIQEAASRPRDLGGATRLTGSADSPNRSLIERTGSAFQNRAAAAGAYDFSLKGSRGFQQWVERWATECLRVLRPGGYIVSFGGTRTYHRLAAGIEDAGFEMRDCLLDIVGAPGLAWMFGSGFPKSLNLDGDREGWGTALKPAFEPIVVARKPLIGTVAANVLAYGTGALNIDGCRIAFRDELDEQESKTKNQHADFGTEPGGNAVYGDYSMVESKNYAAPGRWPANVVLDEDAGAILDEQTGELAPGNHPALRSGRGEQKVYGSGWSSGTDGERRPTEGGGASRFFYCAKVSRSERNAGLDEFEKKPLLWSSGVQSPGVFQADGTGRVARNNHPTVKPIDLMRWLIRLVTPPGGTVLDPFLGSGSTGCAAALEGVGFVGVEREPDYMAIAEARIAFWTEHGGDGLRICAERDASARKRVSTAAAGQLDLLAGEAAA